MLSRLSVSAAKQAGRNFSTTSQVRTNNFMLFFLGARQNISIVFVFFDTSVYVIAMA